MRWLIPVLCGCGGSGLSGFPNEPPPLETDAGTAHTGGDSDLPPVPTGTTGATGTTGDTAPPPAPWSRGLTVDGNPADLPPEARFPAVSAGTWGITWDDTHLYLAANHPDVAGGGPQHWLLAYVGGLGSTTQSGVQFGTQQPGLPVGMSHLIRWKADGSYDSLMAFDGSVWTDTPGFLGTAGSSIAEDEGRSTVELAVAFASLGVGDTFDLHLCWLYEGAGFESTYGAVPTSSFADGLDPDFGAWYRFDRRSSAPPSSYAPSLP